MHYLAIAILIAILQTGCTTKPPSDRSDAYVESCKEKGGRLIQYTELSQGCEWPTNDAGKTCTDKAQCDGYCVPNTKTPQIISQASSGTCSRTRTDRDFPNCAYHLVKGRVTSTGCID